MMRNFDACVFTPSGDELLLQLQGQTLERIRTHLHQQGYTIKKIVEKEQRGLWKKLQTIEIGRPIKDQHRIRILRALGQMIQRGYILENIIDFLLADEREKDVITLLQTLQRKSQKGYKDFVELFREAERYFDQEFFSILLAGQKTGTIGKNMIDYAEGKAKMLEQKGALVKTLSGKFLVFIHK